MTSELPDQDAPTPADPLEEKALTVKPAGLPPAVRNVEELTWEEVEALSRDAVPTTIRRAPKMSRFFIMGAVVGIVLGLMLGLSSSDPDMNKRGVYRLQANGHPEALTVHRLDMATSGLIAMARGAAAQRKLALVRKLVRPVALCTEGFCGCGILNPWQPVEMDF